LVLLILALANWSVQAERASNHCRKRRAGAAHSPVAAIGGRGHFLPTNASGAAGTAVLTQADMKERQTTSSDGSLQVITDGDGARQEFFAR